MSEREKIVLCIPGEWADKSDFLQRVIRSSGGRFLVAGMLMRDNETEVHVECAFHGSDPQMLAAFEQSSVYDPLSEEVRQTIARHSSVVYLISRDAGVAAARTVAQFADVLCAAGGFGVKIEAAGRSFSAANWRARMKDIDSIPMLYGCFVFPLVSASPTAHYGCGMTQFGQPDTMVRGLSDLDHARDLIQWFDCYRLLETPELAEEHTFAVAPDAPIWRMAQEPHPYADDPHIDFSEGVWVLTPVTGETA